MKRNSITIAILLFICFMILVGYFLLKEKLSVVSIGVENEQKKESQDLLKENDNLSKTMDGPVYHEDGSVTIQEGYTSNGFYNLETNAIIDNGTTIEISGDVLQGRISFQQNFPVKRSYLVIVLIDYIQHEFYVEDQSFQSYSFQLEGESKINLDISIFLTESEGTEFSYIIVPQPEEKNYLIDGKYDWNTMFSDRGLIFGRYHLDRLYFQAEKEQEFPQDYIEFQAEGNISGFELVESRSNINVSVEEKGGRTLELVFLNQTQESKETNYVVLGFADWNQIPVDGIHMKYFVTIPADTSVSIPVTLPYVEEPTIFQIVAFSDPDCVLDRFNWSNQTTFRVLVEP